MTKLKAGCDISIVLEHLLTTYYLPPQLIWFENNFANRFEVIGY